jgi:hypothetical protein
MVDNSIKRPFTQSMNEFANERINSFQQIMIKGLPCHVVRVYVDPKTNKKTDLVEVAFDTKNATWTLPRMVMPIAMSIYSRDATQVGDKGMAAPSDYYLGGNSGLGGGVADYSQRGNLTTLVFHPISKTTNEARDTDQTTITGGPNGVKLIQSTQPQQAPQRHASGSTQSPASARFARTRRLAPGRGFRAALPRLTRLPALLDTSQSQSTPMAYMQIDKNGAILSTGKSLLHQVLVDEQNNKVALDVPATTNGKDIVFLGGPGKKQAFYDFVQTASGPSVNVKAKIVAQDEND